MKILSGTFKKKTLPITRIDENEYWNRSLFYNIKQRFIHRDLRKERLLVDVHLQDHYFTLEDRLADRRTPAYVRTDQWTKLSGRELQERGYKRVTGLYDSIVWWTVPVYMKIDGGGKYDISTEVDETGRLLYSQDTAATLHDTMTSRATENFIKGMGKTSISAMDSQKIVMLVIMAVGALFGLWILGVI